MIYNDFRFMCRGKQLRTLKKEDCSLLNPVNQRGPGKERALLLFHGFTSSPAVYRYLIPQLTNYDAIICSPLPGHADSIAAFTNSTSKDWLAHANQECAALFVEYQKVDVLGTSLGGLLACKLSLGFAFNHMFLLAPALKLQMNIERNIKLVALLKSLGFCELRGMAGDLVSNHHAELSYRRIPLTVLLELFALIQEHHWLAPTCPIDLFLGRHDRVVSSIEVEKIFAPLPNARIHWLENSAHVLPLDNDWQQIAQCVNRSSMSSPEV